MTRTKELKYQFELVTEPKYLVEGAEALARVKEGGVDPKIFTFPFRKIVDFAKSEAEKEVDKFVDNKIKGAIYPSYGDQLDRIKAQEIVSPFGDIMESFFIRVFKDSGLGEEKIAFNNDKYKHRMYVEKSSLENANFKFSEDDTIARFDL